MKSGVGTEALERLDWGLAWSRAQDFVTALSPLTRLLLTDAAAQPFSGDRTLIFFLRNPH